MVVIIGDGQAPKAQTLAALGDPALAEAVLRSILGETDSLVMYLDLPSRRSTILHGGGLLGFEPEAVQHMYLLDLLSASDRERALSAASRVFFGSDPSATTDVAVIDAQGDLRSVRMTFRPVATDAATGLVIQIVDLAREASEISMRERRVALDAMVETIARRLAIADDDVLDEALAECAEDLANGLDSLAVGFWTIDSEQRLRSTPVIWPLSVKAPLDALQGESAVHIGKVLVEGPNGLHIVRAIDLAGALPDYLGWMFEIGGSAVTVSRADSEGCIRALSFHTRTEIAKLDSDVLHAVWNMFDVIGNAIDRSALHKRALADARWSEALLESSGDMLSVLDRDSTVRYVNGSVADLGYAPNDLIGMRAIDLVHPDDLEIADSLFDSVVPRTLRFRAATGAWHYLECRVRDLRDDPTINGMLLNTRDVTYRIDFERTVDGFSRAQELLAVVTGRLSAALPGELLGALRKNLADIGSFVGVERVGLWWASEGDAVEVAMFVGADGSDLRPDKPLLVTLPDDLPELVFERLTDTEHPVYDAMYSGELPPLGAILAAPFVGPTGRIGMLTLSTSDVDYEPSEAALRLVPAFAQIVTSAMLRHDAEVRLHHQATTDAVTGLANRSVMRRRLEDDLERAKREGESVALLLLDLDDFKLVNDGYGHLAGDDLLRKFGDRLQQTCAWNDLVARLGGDEFVVVRSGNLYAHEVDQLAYRIHQALRQPFVIDGRNFTVTSSIGVTVFQPGDDSDVEAADLLRRADIAMYRAKNRGPAESERFDESMGQSARGTAILRSDLENAIRTRTLQVAFQPIVEVATGRRIGAEALVRWEHPERGVIGPDVFIPVAERSGLISALGYFVLEESIHALARLRAIGAVDDDFYLSVNVAAPQLREEKFVASVVKAIRNGGIPAKQIRFEITESKLVDRSLLGAMRELRDAGVKLCIDDFGTGYSSLASLQDLPIDVLKIDRSFVQRIDTDRQAAALVAAVVTMANTLGLQTVAEGVETEGQRAALESFNCPAAQGYLFARPIKRAEWLRQSAELGPAQESGIDGHSTMLVLG